MEENQPTTIHSPGTPDTDRSRSRRSYFAWPVKLLVIVLLIAGAWLSINRIQNFETKFQSIDHTRQVMIKADDVLSAVEDAETGQRGYIITGDRSFLDPYQTSQAAVNKLLNDLAALVANNPEQVARVAEARRLTRAKMDELAETVAIADEGHFSDAAARVRNGTGKGYMESLRAVLDEISAREEALLAQHQRELQSASWTMTAALVGYAVFIALVVAVAIGFITRLGRVNESLEEMVDDRTRALQSTFEAYRRESRLRLDAEKQRTEMLELVANAEENERQRIARNIHDNFGQHVTALRLNLAALTNGSSADASRKERLDALRELTERMDEEVSYLAWELSPRMIDELGLVAAIESFAAEWSRYTNIESEFQARGASPDRLHRDTETHIYRIVQEALNNIAKHANAAQVSIILEQMPTAVRLIVEDDGSGFDPDEAKPRNDGHGFGLKAMQERAAVIGGTLVIESSKGSGTTLFLTVPVDRTAAAVT